MKFFTFDQNNSGGHFKSSKAVATYVIVEAHDAEEANRRAEAIGIYFDGVHKGYDCGCCGDRWRRAYDEGTDAPEIYGQSPVEHMGAPDRVVWEKPGEPVVHVYHADGVKETY